MELMINGEQKIVPCNSVTDLLSALAIDPRLVAVELNLAIVPKDLYESTKLSAGDRIEIVHFVGGG